MLAHSFLIKSSSKLLVTRTGIKARMSLISGLGPLVSMAHLYVFWNEIWPWHIELRWAIVALWATCWFIFSCLWYTHVIRIRGCNWMYFEPHRLADVLWLLKIICNLYYFSCRNNSEISESFAVGHEITAKIMTYGIYCLYRYNNPLRDETMW